MQIQINTDRNIDGNEALAAYVRGETEHALSRINDHITRVEVHLSDENSDKKRPKTGSGALWKPGSKDVSPLWPLIRPQHWNRPSTAQQKSYPD